MGLERTVGEAVNLGIRHQVVTLKAVRHECNAGAFGALVFLNERLTVIIRHHALIVPAVGRKDVAVVVTGFRIDFVLCVHIDCYYAHNHTSSNLYVNTKISDYP